MSHLPLYKHILKKDSSTYYRSVNGIVSTTATFTPLEYAPKGWMKNVIKWIRNEKYHGLGRVLTTTYEFVKDGADILRKVKYTEGIEGKCTFEIWKLNDSDWTYSLYFSGDIDFSKTNDGFVTFTANVLDNGKESKIKANENTDYEFIVNATTGNPIIMTGLTLEGTYNYSSAGQNTGIKTLILNVPTVQEGDYPVAENVGQSLAASLGTGTPFDADIIGNTWSTGLYDAAKPLIQANQDMSIEVSFNQVMRLVKNPTDTGTTKPFVRAVVINSSRVVTQAINIYGGATYPSLTYPSIGTFNITAYGVTPYFSINKGDRVYISTYLSNTTSSIDHYLELDGNTSLSTTTPINWQKVKARFTIPQTTCYGIRHCTMFDELTKKVLDTTALSSYSTYLRQTVQDQDNVPYHNFITCGDALRSFSDAKIRMKFTDFFQDASSRAAVGVGMISDVLRLEKIETFYQKDYIIADLGEVSDMKISDALDIMANRIVAGQKEQDYDNLNGRDEFNQSYKFKFPNDRITNEIDMSSAFRFDMYGIEILRSNLGQKKTTDSKSDNDTFVLSTNVFTFLSTPYIGLRRPLFSAAIPATASGLLYKETAFNVDLTTKRSLFRNGSRLAAMAHLRNGKKITFQTTDKNAELQCAFDGGRPNIIEKADINVNDLPAPYCLPIMFEFSAIVPRNIMALMASFAYGCFRFKYKGNLYKGFPMDVGQKPSDNDKYEFRLLSTPDNDITKLYQ